MCSGSAGGGASAGASQLGASGLLLPYLLGPVAKPLPPQAPPFAELVAAFPCQGAVSGGGLLDHYRMHLHSCALAERMKFFAAAAAAAATAAATAAAAAAASPAGSLPAAPSSSSPSSSSPCPSPLPGAPPFFRGGGALARAPEGVSLLTRALYPPRRPPEEPKPQHSYIGLIAQAILSCPERKMVLSDIYQHILDRYAYFRSRGPGWRNSIRHNLSLNDCFVKAGRSANGKGHYWAIHPANLEDFRKGDFRRRKAQRKVRRHLGLAAVAAAAPDDDEDDDGGGGGSLPASPQPPPPPQPQVSCRRRKRRFDMDSLLAPDDDGDCDGSDRATAAGLWRPRHLSAVPERSDLGQLLVTCSRLLPQKDDGACRDDT